MKLNSVSPPILFMSFNIVLTIKAFYPLIYTLESECWYLWSNNLMGIWDWIYKDGRNQHLIIMSLLIHERGISLHLVLWFLLTDYCSSSHKSLIYALFELYLSISFMGLLLNDIVFLISNSTWLLLVWRKWGLTFVY